MLSYFNNMCQRRNSALIRSSKLSLPRNNNISLKMDGPSFPTPKPSELPRLKASTFNSTDLFLAVLALVFVVLLGFLMSMVKRFGMNK